MKGFLVRSTQIVAGYYYHFYNRGVNRQAIFFREENWGYFIRRLRQYSVPEYLTIVAYCLMPNHYHLLVRANHDDVGRKVMQPLTVSYSKSINKQQERSGHLFQGPFQARLIEEDADLKWLSRYVHLNPVTAGLVREPADWIYSSYRDYVGLRNGTLPNPAIVLDQFPSRSAYADFVETDLRPEAGLAADLIVDE